LPQGPLSSMAKNQVPDDDGWESGVAADEGGIFSAMLAFFAAILALFGLGGAKAEAPKIKTKKQPKAPKAPKAVQEVKAPDAALLAAAIADDEPEKKKKKKKRGPKKNKAEPVPDAVKTAVTQQPDAGWEAADNKKAKKAAKKAKVAEAEAAPAPVEEEWSEVAPKKKTKSAEPAAAEEPEWEEAGSKKVAAKPKPQPTSSNGVPVKQAAKYPGAPPYRTVVLNKKSTKLKKRLIAFYEQHCPEKLYEFETSLNDDLIQHYSQSANIDGMATLNQSLMEKYGADLDTL